MVSSVRVVWRLGVQRCQRGQFLKNLRQKIGQLRVFWYVYFSFNRSIMTILDVYEQNNVEQVFVWDQIEDSFFYRSFCKTPGAKIWTGSKLPYIRKKLDLKNYRQLLHQKLIIWVLIGIWFMFKQSKLVCIFFLLGILSCPT